MGKLTRAWQLHDTKTQDELVAMITEVENNPASKAGKCGAYLYNRKAMQLLADIGEAISYHMADTRSAAGTPVEANGYSGRITNRTPCGKSKWRRA